MLSKAKVFSFIFFLIIPLRVFADDFFSIKPYFLKAPGDENILVFKLSQKGTLKIIKKLNSGLVGQESQLHNDISADEPYQISLGHQPCGTRVDLRLESKELSKTVFSTSLSAIACNDYDTIQFGFFGDTQIKKEKNEKYSRKIASIIASEHQKNNFGFLVHVGDVVQTGDSESEWSNFFDLGEGYISQIPFITALGNHEYRGYSKGDDTWETDKKSEVGANAKSSARPDLFFKYMRWPKSDNTGNLVYEWPHFNLIIFNTNFFALDDGDDNYQWEWFEDELKKANSLNKKVIVAMHHAPYSSSLEWVRSIPKKLREKFVPLIESYKNVPLVLSGHLHMYERSKKNGINYIITGPSGGRRNYQTYINPYSQKFKSKPHTFSSIKVNRFYIEVKSYDHDYKQIDELYHFFPEVE